MEPTDVARVWEANAETWTRHVRRGLDVYRDTLNTPAFLAMLPSVAGLTGLDVGCGEGSNTRQVARRGARMNAVDIAPTFVRHAKAAEAGDPLGITFTVGNGMALPFEDGTFDFATAFMSLMDMPDPERALQEAARVLRPAGFLQFSILHPCFVPPHRKVLRDGSGRVRAVEVGGYFDRIDGRPDVWQFTSLPEDERDGTPQFRTPRFHRTLSEWMAMILGAGLVIESLSEPSADRTLAAIEPIVADTLVVPLFLHVRARKPPTPPRMTLDPVKVAMPAGRVPEARAFHAGLLGMKLPVIETVTNFAYWRADRGRWSAVVERIARVAGISAANPLPFATGTNLVVDLDGRSILKLFPAIFRPQFVSERATLRLLAGKLSLPIPTILAEGEQDGWSWLIMTKLDGTVGSEAWPILLEEDKEAVLEDIGRTIAEVQAVLPGALLEIEPTWPDFIASQSEGCVERHRLRGLSPRLLKDIPQILSSVPEVVPLHEPNVILTGEWIPENFLLSETNGRWKLAAVIDFGDVMTGWREYDLLGPSTFMCAGRPARVRRLLAGYGMAPDDCGPEMRRRLFTLMMLHRASDLRNIAIDGWEARIGSLFDLEDALWPT